MAAGQQTVRTKVSCVGSAVRAVGGLTVPNKHKGQPGVIPPCAGVAV